MLRQHKPCHTLAFHEFHALPAGGAGVAAGHKVSIGKTRLRLKANQGRIVKAANGQALAGFLRAQAMHLNAQRLLRRQRLGQGLQLRAFGRGNQVATTHQTGRGVLVLQMRRKVFEDRPGLLGQHHVFDHRIVRAQDPAGLGGGAHADLIALQHQHPFGTHGGQVVGHRSPDHPGPNHDRIPMAHIRLL